MTKSYEQIFRTIVDHCRTWIARPLIRVLDAFEGLARVTVKGP